MKYKKILTIEERRKIHLNDEDMPLGYNIFPKRKGGTTILIGGGDESFFARVGTKDIIKQKVLSIFRKR